MPECLLSIAVRMVLSGSEPGLNGLRTDNPNWVAVAQAIKIWARIPLETLMYFQPKETLDEFSRQKEYFTSEKLAEIKEKPFTPQNNSGKVFTANI